MRTKGGKPGFRDIARLGGRSVIDHLGRLEVILLPLDPSLTGGASAQRISPRVDCDLEQFNNFVLSSAKTIRLLSVREVDLVPDRFEDILISIRMPSI